MENKKIIIKDKLIMKIMKDKIFLKIEPEIIKKRINELKIGIIIDSGENLFSKLDKIDEKILDEIYDDIKNLKRKLNKKVL